MKIDPNVPRFRSCRGFYFALATILTCNILFGTLPEARWLTGGEPATLETDPALSAASAAKPDTSGQIDSDRAMSASMLAGHMAERVIEQLAYGPAFDAKVRQRVWVSGREVVGVGTYEQAGRGSACFNLQLTMHDGDGQHTLQQVSDGRLAWTRQEIGGEVALKRVDVGRLDQWVQDDYRQKRARENTTLQAKPDTVPAEPVQGSTPWKGGRIVRPSVRVGGLTEMLDQIGRDYFLALSSGSLESTEVWILTGTLTEQARERWGLASDSVTKTSKWPELVPTRVIVAIAKQDYPDIGFGQGLPVRIEYWSDPIAIADVASRGDDEKPKPAREHAKSRLISLLELYSLRPITPPPIERFRFDNLDAEVNFVNETDRYLARYGIRLTERQSRTLRR